MLVIRARFKTFAVANVMLAAVSCLVSVNSCFGRGNVSSPSDFFVGGRRPDFKLEDLDGREVQLSWYRGRTVLIDFWATWCGPCGVEIPDLERISKQFAKNDMVVLGINA